MTRLRDLTEAQSSIAEENGITRKALGSRLEYGWSVEKAISTPPIRKKGVRTFYRVRVTDEDLERAEQNGISEKTLKSRCKKGWDLERAITQPYQKQQSGKRKSREVRHIEDDELIAIIGRIKYLRMQEKDFPMPIPKPLLIKLKQTGRTLDDVQALKC